MILLVLAFQGVAANELWDQAVSLYGEYGDLLPGRMLIAFTQYNGRDELISTEESLLSIGIGSDGEPETTIVWATKDGEDVTEERRENPQGGSPFGGGPDSDGEEEDEGNAFSGLQKSPFDPAEQEHVVITATPTVERVAGVVTRRFDFVHETGADSPNVGSAWLATDTGMPVKLELTLESFPFYLESFLMTQYFGRDERDRWVSKTLEFSGSGRLLFFQRTIESTLEFSDYFRAP